MLERYARAARLPVSVDETNADLRYRRNAIRALLANLETSSPGATRSIARSAAIISDDKALLDGLTRIAWKRALAEADNVLSAATLRRMPNQLLLRVIRHAVRMAAGTTRNLSYEHCAAIARALKDRRGGSYHAGTTRATLSAGKVTFETGERNAAAATLGIVRIKVPPRSASVAWQGGRVKLRVLAPNGVRAASSDDRAPTATIRLDAAALKPGSVLSLRSPRAGDKIVPAGRHRAVSLARFLAKEGVVRRDRFTVPLLLRNGALAAVVGVRAADAFASRPGGKVLEVRWTPPKALRLTPPADE
jgi:tRNA(Ile)-lysidine synthase